MKHVIALAAVTLASLGIAGTATAQAAPGGRTDADQIVMQLQGQGNTVVVNRTGTLPLSQCTVIGVRPGHTYSRYDSGYPGAQSDPMTTITSMTVYLDAKC
jgi:hypothetical protein